jgi:hypothetical protein
MRRISASQPVLPYYKLWIERRMICILIRISPDGNIIPTRAQGGDKENS